MNASVTQELTLLQSGNHPEDPLLFRDPQPSLESDQVPHLPCPVFAAQLHHRVRLPAISGIGQADRLHRAEAQCLRTAPSHLLDGEAALEIGDLVKVVAAELVRRDQFREERLVGVPIERRVEVVVSLTLPVSG